MEELIDDFIRDIHSAYRIPKTEIRRRIEEIISFSNLTSSQVFQDGKESPPLPSQL